MNRAALLTVALAAGISSGAHAQAQNKVDLDALSAKGVPVFSITPIFSQLVVFSFPTGFKTIFENTKGDRYIREAVLAGETGDKWSQMVTVTGAKDLASNPKVTPQGFLEAIASGFKRACPDT